MRLTYFQFSSEEDGGSMLFFLAATPALRIEGTQGSIGAWSVRGAASRQHLRGQTANIPLGAARINRPDAVNTEEAPLQGDVQAWAVRGAAARDQLRGQNHGDASFSGGVQPTKPVYKAMTGNTEEANVQGDVLAWSVRGAASRQQLRVGDTSAGPSLGARRINDGVLLTDGRTGNSENNGVSGHVQAAPVQGHVAHWTVRGAAARDQLRGQNHDDASFSGGVQPTKPVYKAMTGNSEEAHPQAAPVQGNVLAWSVRGAAARNQLRGGQDASEATRDIEATLPMTARTGNSEDAHPQAAPVQV